MNKKDKTALQWFAINLLTGSLTKNKDRGLIYADTSVILDVGPQDLKISFAMNSSSQSLIDSLNHLMSSSSYKLQAYGHLIKLVTLSFKNLGLYSSRYHIYTNNNTNKPDDVRSVCVNPIVDSIWSYNDTLIRVRGVEKGDMEMVKERNGPFAGKKINRPVANYDKCHRLSSHWVESRISPDEKSYANFRKLMGILKGRGVFMEGLLLEKAFERGLSLPIRGGGVKMKHFSESLKHACKIPNTEQPFACTDLMYLATVLDRFFGFKQGSLLHSPRNIKGDDGRLAVGCLVLYLSKWSVILHLVANIITQFLLHATLQAFK